MGKRHPDSHLYQKSCAGNIGFFLLISLALFAALFFALAHTDKNQSSSISREQNTIAAAQLLQYTTQIDGSLNRMKLIHGCSDTQLSFEPAPFDSSGPYANPNAPADKSCHLFHPNGGELSPFPLRSNYNVSAESPAVIWFTDSVVPDAATDDSDLIFMIENISVDICKEINKKLGISNQTPPATQRNADIPVAYNGVILKKNFNLTNVPRQVDFCATEISPTGEWIFTRYFHVIRR